MANWINRFKEKEGRKGLLPWLSVTTQMWILVGLAFVGLIGTIITITNGSYFPLGWLFTATGALAVLIGLKTDWARNVDKASKPIKITGAIAIGAGTLLAIVTLAYILFWVVVVILAIALFVLVLFLLLKAYFSEKDRGETIIQEGSRASGDYERGYQDGREAGRTAKAHGKSDSALGELVGSMLAGIEEVIDETCNFAESEEYKEGFRNGIQDTW